MMGDDEGDDEGEKEAEPAITRDKSVTADRTYRNSPNLPCESTKGGSNLASTEMAVWHQDCAPTHVRQTNQT